MYSCITDQAAVVAEVKKAQAGDREALGQLYALYYHQLIGWLIKRTYSCADAEDILHSAFVAVVKHINALQNPHAFKSWLYRIVARRLYAHMRVDRRQRRLISRASRCAQVSPSISPQYEFVDDALAELSLVSQRTVRRFYFDLRSIREIAAEERKPVSTIKGRLFSARQKLAAVMAEAPGAHTS